MNNRIIFILLSTLLNATAQSAIIDTGDIVDCQPIEQQYIINSQINNKLPLTNPQKIRFTVTSDRSIEARLTIKPKNQVSVSGAIYSGEENFTTLAEDVKVSKWSVTDEHLSQHHLYFAFNKDNEIILEERISKDDFQRMFVISYSCKAVVLKPKKPRVSFDLKDQTNPLENNMPATVKSNNSFQAAHNSPPIASIQRTNNLKETTQEVDGELKQYLNCLGSYKSKSNNNKNSQPINSNSSSISLIYDKDEGRFEIPKGWDKYTENGLTAWIDQKEVIRNGDRKDMNKVNLYATLENTINESSTYLIFKTDTLKLFIKYEKLSTGLTDTFEGVCSKAN